jgi:hypothetical protein
MNEIIKDPHDSTGICVYIAPTKALVNQVAGKSLLLLASMQILSCRFQRQSMSSSVLSLASSLEIIN